MPVFNLQLQFDEKGAVVAIRHLNDVANAADRTKDATVKAGNEMGDSIWSVTKKLTGLIGAYKSLEKAMGFLKRGIDLNSSLEQSKIGIATLITSMAKLEDAQGRALEGAEKYAAAQGLAGQMMAEIQKLGLETTATSQELVEGVQSIMGPALQAGMALKDIPKFAVAGAQAMQTLGIPLNQMRTELEALLSGSVNKTQDILAPKLFADVNGDLNEYLKNLKASGTLLAEIEKRLEPFRQAGADVGQTWTGIVNNLEEAADTVAGIVSQDLLDKLKEGASLIQNFLITDSGNVGIAKDFENIAGVLTEISNVLGAFILGAIKEVVELGKAFNNFIGVDAVGRVKELGNAFVALGAGIGMHFFAKLAQSIKPLSQSLIQSKEAALGCVRAERVAYIEYLKTDEAKKKLRASTEAVAQTRAKLKALTQQVTAAEVALNQAMSRTAMQNAVSAGVGNLAKSMAGLVNFMGGPLGVGMTVAGAAVAYLGMKEDDTAKSTRLLTEAQEAYEQAIGKATDATGKLTRALTDAERKQMEIAAGKALASWNLQIDEFDKKISSLSLADTVSLANGFTGSLVSPELQEFMDEFDRLVKKLREDGPQGTEAFIANNY